MPFYKRKNRIRGFRPNTQMNVTALVDVTLVTLIIYILVSPALEHGIDVQLPVAKPYKMVSQEPAVVSVSKKGDFFFNNILVTEEQLQDKLSELAGAKPDSSVIIRADNGISYGIIIGLLDIVRETGLVNIGLVTRSNGG